MAGHLAPGGYAILSGILTRQADDVVEVYARNGINQVRRDVIGDWVEVATPALVLPHSMSNSGLDPVGAGKSGAALESSLHRFEKRQKSIRRKHSRMAKGYVNTLDKRSGLITQKPDSKGTGRGLRLLILVGLAFLAFKGFVLAGLGEDQYLQHVAQLQSGSAFEKAGAWLMQIDPATAMLSDLLAPLLA